MASVDIHDIEGGVVGSVDLPDAVFGVEPSKGALYYTLKAFHTNQRQGNASTLTRANVDLTKKKMYRQKGTGRARMGTASSPIRVGGGVAHGPHPRTLREQVPKKVRRLALRSALSMKAAAGTVRVVDFSLESPKTKQVAGMLKGIGAEGRILLLTGAPDQTVHLSCRNIPKVVALPASQVSAYEVVWAELVVLTQDALTVLQSRTEAA